MRQAPGIMLMLCLILLFGNSVAQADLFGIRQAQRTVLRVHDVGTKYGPPSDQIDVEVVIPLAQRDGAFGFQLLDDAQRAARQGMLDLLRDAFNHNWLVSIDYEIEPPKKMA